MRKYYYTDGTTNYGPFSLEELKEKGITRETFVWFQGMNEWQKAGSVPELNELFATVPPPIQPRQPIYTNSPQGQQPPKTWLVESILVTLFCCLPLGVVGIVNASKVESKYFAGDVAGATQASAEAKRWTTLSFWLGMGFYVVYVIFLIVAGVAGAL